MTLKLGVIGLSEGNGHPYSWSAIFNGYDKDLMEECGFPVIPRYLEKQRWPQDAILEGKVTHIWTQDIDLSVKVANTSFIENVVQNPQDLIGQVDGILLARDDAETHYELAAPFIQAGMPIYIDKPICHTLAELEAFYAIEKYAGQIFTCSAMRFAREFELTDSVREKVGELRHVFATTPKDWERYGVHVIEPLLQIAGEQGVLLSGQRWRQNDTTIVNLKWESGFQATISAVGEVPCPLGFRIIGTNGWHDTYFEDTFFAFKAALVSFVKSIRTQTISIEPSFVRRVVEVIEFGRKV